MSFKNTPITAKIKKSTKGGMVQQPILNMGAPVKMKVTPGSPKRNLKDLAQNSQARQDEYTRRGWKQDATTRRQSDMTGGYDTGWDDARESESEPKVSGDLSMTPYSSKNGKGTIHGPKVSNDMAYEKASKTKEYGGMSKASYAKEAKRQTKKFKETGEWDAKRKTSSVGNKPSAKTKKISVSTKLDTNADLRKTAAKPVIAKNPRKAKSIDKKQAKADKARASGNEKKALRKENSIKRKEARIKKRSDKKK